MDSFGITSSFKPINREFLFYHRDKERLANEETSVEREKGEEKSIANEICSTLNDIPNKLTEFPIIFIDKRDNLKNNQENLFKNKSSSSKTEHPCLQLYDKKYPPITYTLNSFVNCKNNNNNNNCNETSNSNSSIKENPLYLLNLMKSKNKNSFQRLEQQNRNNDILSISNSMTSYCEMVNAADMYKNSKKYNQKYSNHQPDYVQKINRKNTIFDSSIDLAYKNSSLKDFIIQAESFSNHTKSYLLQEDKKSSEQEFKLKYINSFDSFKNGQNINYNQNNNIDCNYESNLMKASRIHQSQMKEKRLGKPNDCTSSNDSYNDDKYLYPYTTNESVLFKKLNKFKHLNVEHSILLNNYLMGMKIVLNCLKNLVLIFLLLLLVWPLTVFFKFCWLISKYLSSIFPNLDDICAQLNNFYAKFLYYEEKLMDNISSLK